MDQLTKVRGRPIVSLCDGGRFSIDVELMLGLTDIDGDDVTVSFVVNEEMIAELINGIDCRDLIVKLALRMGLEPAGEGYYALASEITKDRSNES